MRPVFLWLHRWLGLSAALVISFLGLTGAALVFRAEIDARFNPNLLTVAPQAQRAPLQPVVATLQKHFPDRKISFLFAAKTPTGSDEWWLDKGKFRVYVNPYSGEILGERSESDSIFSFLFTAHTELFAGETGEQIAAWSGVILGGLTVSGLILWLPRRLVHWKTFGKRAFWPHWKTNRKGRLYELHRVGGFYLSGLLLMTAFTGVALVWHDLSDQIAAPFGIANVKKVRAGDGILRSLDELVQNADKAFPDGKLARIAFPAKSGAPVVIRKKLPAELHPNGMNNVALDGTTGRVLSVTDSRHAPPGQRFLNLRYPLHIGGWGGNFSRLLAVIVGLSPLFFSLTGFFLWNNKRRRRRNKQQSQNDSAPRLHYP